MKFNKGSALISALFIMTLIAIAATAMSLRLHMDIHRTQLTIKSDKLKLASEAVSFWAMDVLSDKKNHLRKADKQGKVLIFPATLKNIYPGATVEGSLFDLQARYNLNNVSDKRFVQGFISLLKNRANLRSKESYALAFTLRDWLNPYQPGSNSTIHLKYYEKQKPPYLPAFQMMESASEFRLLEGVTQPIYAALIDYVTALPELTPININTAPNEVLATLGGGLKQEQIDELISQRGDTGIQKMDKIGPFLEKLQIRSEFITLESKYYMSVAKVQIDDLQLVKYTFLRRYKNRKGDITVSVLRESLNAV